MVAIRAFQVRCEDFDYSDAISIGIVGIFKSINILNVLNVSVASFSKGFVRLEGRSLKFEFEAPHDVTFLLSIIRCEL